MEVHLHRRLLLIYPVFQLKLVHVLCYWLVGQSVAGNLWLVWDRWSEVVRQRRVFQIYYGHLYYLWFAIPLLAVLTASTVVVLRRLRLEALLMNHIRQRQPIHLPHIWGDEDLAVVDRRLGREGVRLHPNRMLLRLLAIIITVLILSAVPRSVCILFKLLDYSTHVSIVLWTQREQLLALNRRQHSGSIRLVCRERTR